MTAPASAPEPSPEEDIDVLTGEIGRLQGLFEGWDGPQGAAARTYGAAIERLHGLALRRLVAALRGEPAARAALREAAGDPVVYAVLRRHNIVKASLNERIEAAIASVRPTLGAHGGDVELTKLAPPMAEVKISSSPEPGMCGKNRYLE